MVRTVNPWGHAKQSWTINEIYQPSSSRGTSSYERLKLLIWKNYKLQTRNKLQTFLELLFPLIFIAILVVVRVLVPSTHINEPTIFPPLEIDGVPPYVIREKCNMIYYAPTNGAIDNLIQEIKLTYFDAANLKYNFTGFENEDELLEAYDQAKNEDESASADFETTSPVLAGIVFENDFDDGGFPKNIKYKLRFPASQRSDYDAIAEKFGLKAAWFTELIYPLFQLLGPRAKDKISGGLPGYYEEGFLYLQYAVDRTLIRMVLNDSTIEHDKYDIKLQRFPYPSYIDDKYLFGLQAFLPLLLILSMLFPVLHITKGIVYEKEKRLKESMKMMGLSNGLLWTAWILKSQLFLMISSVMIAALLKARFVSSQEMAVIPETDITVLIFIIFIYSFSAVSFSCFISTLFSRANTAALAGGTFWFFIYVPYAFIQPRYNTLSRTFKLVCSFLTNNPIGFISQIICNFEGIGVGVQWSNLSKGSTPDDNFSIADCLVLLSINSLVFLLAAFYIEAVWPGEFGIRLPFDFFLKKWYWTGSFRHAPEYDLGSNSKTNNNSPYFEPDPSQKHAGVEIRNLTKRFREKTAVNRMNLKMYPDQVTALLGHNGAGKTTTMSILTGLFPPTSGTALVNGYDICSDMNSVRASLGICPQHDVLFDELTVEEHLQFFCKLKGLDKEKVDSEVVLLDEPTSGMDPGARRSTWDLIQSEKKNRTVLLSTHFMEEADLLGDRIAIMSQGVMQCVGSSLFLKKKYGGGYHLVIVKTQECVVENITNVLKTAIPDIEIDQDIGAELSYVLPDSKSHLFSTLFSELEEKRKDLGIASYGASITTMENVFMRVLREAEEATLREISEEEQLRNDELKLQMQEAAKTYSDRNTGLTLWLQQLWGMLIKRMLFITRNHMLVFGALQLPISYVVITFCIMNAFPGFNDPAPLIISLDSYETVGKTTTTIHCPTESKICNSYKEFISHNDYITADVSQNSTLTDFILEKASKELAIVNFQHIIGFEERMKYDANKKGRTNVTELIGFWNNQPFHAAPLTLNFITNALLRMANHSIEITNHPFPYSTLDSLKEQGGVLTIGFQVGYNLALAMSFLAGYFILIPIRERTSGSKHLQYISGVKPLIFWITSFVTDLMQFVLPCFGIIAVLVLFKMEEFSTLVMQGYFLMLCGCFGLAMIPLVYILSFKFQIPTSGFAVIVVSAIFTGLAPMFAIALIQNPEFGLEELADSINKYALIFPNYALGMGIVQLSSNFQLSKSCSQHFNLEFLCSAYPDSICCNKLKEDYLDWERTGIGRNIVYLLISAAVYALILVLIECKFFQGLRKCCSSPKIKDDDDSDSEEVSDTLEDSDVLAERNRIANGSLSSLSQNNNLIVRNLSKYYDDFLAVDELNLGVQRGECFGLLGINGAGKTTTFKMVTGDLEPSSGDAYVAGYSVTNQLKKAHQMMGYCPQFDGLIGEMTGRETIRMFARLRGIREKDIGVLTNELSERLLFTPHIDKNVDNCSGGNKRKISTIVSMIGNPRIIFLDEPTTGMDPVARRHLWDAITLIRNQGTSIVLTSHSMEECEALCTRLAIMVNGRMQILGSPQHLKNKFGKGYTIIAQTAAKVIDPDQPFTRSQQEQGRRRSSNKSIKRKRSDQQHYWELELQDLRKYIEERFPACTLKDIHPCFVHYHIHPDVNVSWGELFSAMEVAKVRFKLEAYSVGQTSLEQVFLNFTKSQINTA
ncbi:ATP-binding cassette sub-family A member 3 [Orchesella cincta]|uniref:ATP-binding cassette sub-family A member 3 n=1 Tax=Orchesella cincta TaxID=48709 RepID=A0A1D2MX90_ORCCI|nr:ATP-binding cassette sub-family A member 3 [Orchesella cincta]